MRLKTTWSTRSPAGKKISRIMWNLPDMPDLRNRMGWVSRLQYNNFGIATYFILISKVMCNFPFLLNDISSSCETVPLTLMHWIFIINLQDLKWLILDSSWQGLIRSTSMTLVKPIPVTIVLSRIIMLSPMLCNYNVTGSLVE